MNKAIYYLLLLVMFATGITLKFSTSHEAMPIGCDEFGYLNLAKTMNDGKHGNTIFMKALLDTLRGEKITEQEISWMVTPHAYHVVPGTDTIINQYPPATSFLLSLIPIQWRKLLFPLVVMIFLLLIPILASKNYLNGSWNLFDFIFPVLIFLVTVSAPFTTELARVNSLAFTFGLLLSAGMVLKHRPLLACFLIALTANFRIANILMVLPVLLFLPLQTAGKLKPTKDLIKLLTFYCLLILIAIVPVLLYNYQLLGNPLASTYSVIDTESNKVFEFIKNIKYYFNPDHRWLRVHLLVIVALILFCLLSKFSFKDLIKLLAFPVLNYMFFCWHSVTMDYYPYASALVLCGAALAVTNEIPVSGKYQLPVALSGILIAGIVLFTGMNSYRKKNHTTFQQSGEKYITLCQYDVVWCDLFSGTTEYVCENNGFRYATSTPRARKIAFEFLYKNKLNQAILIEDVPGDASEIIREIKNAKINYNTVNDKNLGVILEIPGIRN